MTSPSLHRVAGRAVQHWGYLVDDIAAAVERWTTLFGAGPFFWIGREMSLPNARFRDQPCVFKHSAVVGRWGDSFVELLQVHDVAPIELREPMLGAITQPNQLHHICFAVEDPEAEALRLQSHGIERFWHATQGPLDVSYCDGRDAVGHTIELHKSGPEFDGLFAVVAAAAQNWTGEDPIRDLPH